MLFPSAGFEGAITKRGSYVKTATFQHALSAARDKLDTGDAQDEVLWHDIHAFRFLWQDYEPRYYLWEVVETFRRIFFSAALAVVRPGTNLQTVVGVGGSVFAAAVYTCAMPFMFDDDDLVQTAAAWGLALTLYVCQLLKSNTVLTEKTATAFFVLGVILPLSAMIYALARLYGRRQPVDAVADSSADDKAKGASPDAPPGLWRSDAFHDPRERFFLPEHRATTAEDLEVIWRSHAPVVADDAQERCAPTPGLFCER